MIDPGLRRLRLTLAFGMCALGRPLTGLELASSLLILVIGAMSLLAVLRRMAWL